MACFCCPPLWGTRKYGELTPAPPPEGGGFAARLKATEGLRRFMQAVKGKTSHHLLQDHRRLRKDFWGRHLWGRGYFVASSGNVTDDVIEEYIEKQGV